MKICFYCCSSKLSTLLKNIFYNDKINDSTIRIVYESLSSQERQKMFVIIHGTETLSFFSYNFIPKNKRILVEKQINDFLMVDESNMIILCVGFMSCDNLMVIKWFEKKSINIDSLFVESTKKIKICTEKGKIVLDINSIHDFIFSIFKFCDDRIKTCDFTNYLISLNFRSKLIPVLEKLKFKFLTLSKMDIKSEFENYRKIYKKRDLGSYDLEMKSFQNFILEKSLCAQSIFEYGSIRNISLFLSEIFYNFKYELAMELYMIFQIYQTRGEKIINPFLTFMKIMERKKILKGHYDKKIFLEEIFKIFDLMYIKKNILKFNDVYTLLIVDIIAKRNDMILNLYQHHISTKYRNKKFPFRFISPVLYIMNHILS